MIGIFIGAFIAVYTVGHITIKVHFPFGSVNLPIGSFDKDSINNTHIYDDEDSDDDYEDESDESDN